MYDFSPFTFGVTGIYMSHPSWVVLVMPLNQVAWNHDAIDMKLNLGESMFIFLNLFSFYLVQLLTNI